MTRELRTQMSTRYPQALVDEAHAYALTHGLSLKVVLVAALAEYLAKRRGGDNGPAPQLHYKQGHAPAEVIKRQQALMTVDPRGRKLRDRCSRVAASSAVSLREHSCPSATPSSDV